MKNQASKILMIQPVNFGYNPQTAVNNSFQSNPGHLNIQQMALDEFNAFAKILRDNKIELEIIKDTISPSTPDSIFPNNWISFHEDNSIFLYPMFAINRRHERKTHIIGTLKEKFIISQIHDLSHHENNESFLEGTGSMVLDRINKIAYAAISPRTDLQLLNEFCRISKYQPAAFTSIDKAGKAIYHTNVMMCVANKYVVICLDSIKDNAERKILKQLFDSTGKELIDISFDQMNHFAGNMLQLISKDEEFLLVMSTQAFNSLTESQKTKLLSYNRIVHSSLETIETCGGGSARCMMAEIFNQPK